MAGTSTQRVCISDAGRLRDGPTFSLSHPQPPACAEWLMSARPARTAFAFRCVIRTRTALETDAGRTLGRARRIDVRLALELSDVRACWGREHSSASRNVLPGSLRRHPRCGKRRFEHVACGSPAHTLDERAGPFGLTWVCSRMKTTFCVGPGAAEGAFEATGDAPVSLPRAPGHRPCLLGLRGSRDRRSRA